jgi:hypothetical protein
MISVMQNSAIYISVHQLHVNDYIKVVVLVYSLYFLYLIVYKL